MANTSTVAASDFTAYKVCELCPRHCRAHRAEGRAGLCGATAELRVARAALHFWEEPPISGESGSGAIFFSGCPLRCVFCQNHEISQEGFGLPVTTGRLAQMMLDLRDQGALNINLVTPSHYLPHVVEAVRLARGARPSHRLQHLRLRDRRGRACAGRHGGRVAHGL